MEAPWARIAINFYRHPRTRRLSKDAQHLYLASILHCVEFSTDGRFPADETPLLASVSRVRPSLEDELITAGVWIREGEELVIRDFLDHQTSAADVKAASDRARRAAKTRWNKAQSGSESPPDAAGDAPSTATGNAKRNASREEKRREEKTPPDPPGFEQFWQVWPRRESRKAAARAFSKAAKVAGGAEQLVALAEKWLADRPDMERRFVPLGATWLNGERWNDDPPPARSEQPPQKQAVF